MKFIIFNKIKCFDIINIFFRQLKFILFTTDKFFIQCIINKKIRPPDFNFPDFILDIKLKNYSLDYNFEIKLANIFCATMDFKVGQ